MYWQNVTKALGGLNPHGSSSSSSSNNSTWGGLTPQLENTHDYCGGLTPPSAMHTNVDILAKVRDFKELNKKSSLEKRWGAMQHVFLHRISMRVLLA